MVLEILWFIMLWGGCGLFNEWIVVQMYRCLAPQSIDECNKVSGAFFWFGTLGTAILAILLSSMAVLIAIKKFKAR